MTDRAAQRRSWLAIVASTGAVLSSLLFSLLPFNRSVLSVILLIAVVSLFLGAASVLLLASGRTLIRHVRIAMVGPPGVGKTVFVTSLFDSLQSDIDSRIAFAPSAEAINRVLATLNGLASGSWPTRTPTDFLYMYRAQLSQLSIKRRLLRSRVEFDVEIADVAGEQEGELLSWTEVTPERTSYFRYVVSSDALLLFISAELFREPSLPTDMLRRQVNELISVLQTVAEAHTATPSDLIEVPVAIVITKCDLLESYSVVLQPDASASDAMYFASRMEELRRSSELRRLRAVADRRFRSVEVFAVSATGPLPDPAKPPHRIEPVGVQSPMLWFLEMTKRSSRQLSSSREDCRRTIDSGM